MSTSSCCRHGRGPIFGRRVGRLGHRRRRRATGRSTSQRGRGSGKKRCRDYFSEILDWASTHQHLLQKKSLLGYVLFAALRDTTNSQAAGTEMAPISRCSLMATFNIPPVWDRTLKYDKIGFEISWFAQKLKQAQPSDQKLLFGSSNFKQYKTSIPFNPPYISKLLYLSNRSWMLSMASLHNLSLNPITSVLLNDLENTIEFFFYFLPSNTRDSLRGFE